MQVRAGDLADLTAQGGDVGRQDGGGAEFAQVADGGAGRVAAVVGADEGADQSGR